MQSKVLILGGRGRIGTSVALDLLTHTQAQVVVTGRSTATATSPLLEQFSDRLQYLPLDLADESSLSAAISPVDLVVHCAGPFRQRTTAALKTCIAEGVNYVDVSDDRVFTQAALENASSAEAAGVTAIINTGVFPGISNSMVRQGIEQLEAPEEIQIKYVVAGSGGAGVTVMRTTFLNIQHAFDAWVDGRWQKISPYTDRETVNFPDPFGKASVYWFDMPESFTLAKNFPVKTVTTKFGTLPDFYNHLTWMTAHLFPQKLMQHPSFIEALAHISHRMTSVTDRFSGTGVAIRVDVLGQKNGMPARYYSTFVHDSAAIATGLGTGSIGQFMLSQQIQKPGVWPVEAAVTTADFEKMLASRGLVVTQNWY
ncbi:saccharopine dehydrogenase family protein [Altericista sp. CCNU0014]|uniref:saccharopine dehydrogenase family protein n=1 Tax=Altericista sp. CCNU0014 TaxID=3082949 RepID=UPI00384DC1BE